MRMRSNFFTQPRQKIRNTEMPGGGRTEKEKSEAKTLLHKLQKTHPAKAKHEKTGVLRLHDLVERRGGSPAPGRAEPGMVQDEKKSWWAKETQGEYS